MIQVLAMMLLVLATLATDPRAPVPVPDDEPSVTTDPGEQRATMPVMPRKAPEGPRRG